MKTYIYHATDNVLREKKMSESEYIRTYSRGVQWPYSVYVANLRTIQCGPNPQWKDGQEVTEDMFEMDEYTPYDQSFVIKKAYPIQTESEDEMWMGLEKMTSDKLIEKGLLKDDQAEWMSRIFGDYLRQHFTITRKKK